MFFRQLSDFLSEWVPLYNYTPYTGSRSSSPSLVPTNRAQAAPAPSTRTTLTPHAIYNHAQAGVARGDFNSPVQGGRMAGYGTADVPFVPH